MAKKIVTFLSDFSADQYTYHLPTWKTNFRLSFSVGGKQTEDPFFRLFVFRMYFETAL
jgi:hypothetical protein